MDPNQTPRWGELPEEEGDDTPYQQKFKSSFIQRWMAREHPLTSPEETEEKAEDSTDNKKKKRFGKLFSRLFPSIATKGEKEEASEVPKRSFFAELIPDTVHESSEPKPEAVVTGESPGPELQQETAIAETTPTEQLMNHEEVSYSVPETRSHDVEPESMQQYENPVPVPEVPPPFFATIPPEVRSSPPTTEHEPQEVAISKQKLIEQASLTPRISEIPPTERRHGAGAVVAFLAAEYLSRRRDKKLQKEIKKLEKVSKTQREQVKDLNTKVKNTESPKTAAYNRATAQAAPELTSAPDVTARREYDVRPVVPVGALEKLTKHKEKKDQTGNIDHIEDKTKESSILKPDIKSEKGKAAESTNIALFLKQREKQLEEMRKKPAQALELKNGEIDKRSEREFDRRHEILDESPARILPGLSRQSLLTTSATSIGEVLQRKQRQDQLSAANGSRDSSDLATGDTVAKSPSSLYRQSAQYGVGAALAIIVIGLLAYRIF